MKKPYTIQVGTRFFTCELQAHKVSEMEKGQLQEIGADIVPDVIFSADDMANANRALALQFVQDEVENISPAEFDFILNVTELRAAEVAQYLAIDRASISQWRKDTALSKAAWTACKVLYLDVLTNRHVTLPSFLERVRNTEI